MRQHHHDKYLAHPFFLSASCPLNATQMKLTHHFGFFLHRQAPHPQPLPRHPLLPTGKLGTPCASAGLMTRIVHIGIGVIRVKSL